MVILQRGRPTKGQDQVMHPSKVNPPPPFWELAKTRPLIVFLILLVSYLVFVGRMCFDWHLAMPDSNVAAIPRFFRVSARWLQQLEIDEEPTMSNYSCQRILTWYLESQKPTHLHPTARMPPFLRDTCQTDSHLPYRP